MARMSSPVDVVGVRCDQGVALPGTASFCTAPRAFRLAGAVAKRAAVRAGPRAVAAGAAAADAGQAGRRAVGQEAEAQAADEAGGLAGGARHGPVQVRLVHGRLLVGATVGVAERC